jgi:DNA modification methylase
VQQHGTGALNIDATRGPDGQWPANVAKFPKAPPSERPMVNGEQHPTVKSVALCRWLVRLVTPPGGTVLDLFAGTGPVGQAARAEGMKAVLIEQDEQSIGFIRARLDARAKTEAGAAVDDGEPVDLLDLLGGDAS